MRVIRALLAMLASVLPVGTQLLCYISAFGLSLYYAETCGWVRNVQSAGWDSAIFALSVLFHWTVALALAAVLERRRLGHPLRAADLMRIPVALLGAVMRSGLVSICVFGAGLLLLAPALWRPGLSEFLAAPALLFAYAFAWIPFVASHWRRHE